MGEVEPLVIQVDTEDELPVAAGRLLEFAGDRHVFLLSGDLGAGKTALVKAVCRWLNADQEAASPTFSLVNEYTYRKGGEEKIIYHLDLYRLESTEEALDIGIEDVLGRNQLCFIEWPAIVEPLLEDEAVRVSIEVGPGEERKLIIL
jgi:tRNA threonylcarbamoyladenosine biosynthesis protein TsaE